MKRVAKLSCVWFWVSLVLMGLNNSGSVVEANSPNYRDALAKSLLFFQGQRSGRLPKNQKLTWRSHSGLYDGRLAHVRLHLYIHIYYIGFVCCYCYPITTLSECFSSYSCHVVL